MSMQNAHQNTQQQPQQQQKKEYKKQTVEWYRECGRRVNDGATFGAVVKEMGASNPTQVKQQFFALDELFEKENGTKVILSKEDNELSIRTFYGNNGTKKEDLINLTKEYRKPQMDTPRTRKKRNEKYKKYKPSKKLLGIEEQKKESSE